MAGAKKDVVKAALKGVKNAFAKYGKWSGGEWLQRAPEGFLQFEIAESLKEIGCAYVTLEDSVNDIIEWSTCNMVGKPPKNLRGRVDIVIWTKKPQPKIIVEVKKAQAVKALNQDAERIRTILNKCKNIKYGLAVAYSHAKTKEKIMERFKEIAQNINGTLEDFDIDKEDGNFWGGGVFSIKL